SGYTNRHALSGLFVVLLSISDGANQYALVTVTEDNTGSYDFNGNAKAIQLPNGLTEEQQVGFAILNYTSGVSLATSSLVGGSPSDPIQKITESGVDYYFFKQGAYRIFVVDPLEHISNGVYQADNSSVASETLTSGVVLNVTSVLAHKPRRKVSGTLVDAFTTVAVSGAQVELLKRVNQNLVSVYRDYDIISTTTRLNPAAHLLVAPLNTDSSGQYSFENIDPGDYVLRITRNGYEDQLIDITVPWNSNVVANSNLIPNNGRGNLEGRVLLAGGHPFTGTYAIELVHPVSGVRPTTGVQPASLTNGAAIWSGTSQYSIFSVNAGQWKVKFTSAGYKSVEGLVNIPANGKVVFDIITAIPDSQGPANIRGVVRNAFNNKPVRGLTVRIRPGLNIKSGPYALDGNNQTIPAVNTDSNGVYLIPNVPAGNYTLEVSGTGTANNITETYITTYATVISAGSNTPSSQDVLVSPVLGDNEIRIVLQWQTNDPRDLDSHFEFGNKDCRIKGTLTNKHTCQIYWKWKKPNSSYDPLFSGLTLGDASLDYDVVTGYGPETITINNSIWTFTGPNTNRMGYTVFNWSQRYYSSKTIKDSRATVRVYKKDGLVRTYNAGNSEVNLWWPLFCINKSTKAIVDVGQAGCSASDFVNDPGIWDGRCDNNNHSDTNCHY
ncbi:MAG: carboxypeptidase regulatory-like domain-containing protein, partial [Leptonema sp. (in: bacteria)]